MRIKVLKDFWIPNKRGYKSGEEYDVTEAVGVDFVKRGIAEKVEEKTKKNKKDISKK